MNTPVKRLIVRTDNGELISLELCLVNDPGIGIRYEIQSNGQTIEQNDTFVEAFRSFANIWKRLKENHHPAID